MIENSWFQLGIVGVLGLLILWALATSDLDEVK